MSRDIKFTPEEQASIQKVTDEVNKNHNRAVWRTRIAVSFITSLVISCLISIGVSSILVHNSREDALVNSYINCHNLVKIRNVGINANQKALDTINSIRLHKHLTTQEKQQYIISVNYYTNILHQYKSVTCDRLR